MVICRSLLSRLARFSFLLLLAMQGQANAEILVTGPEMIAEGGRLYDKWWEEYDLRKPTSTHPAYPLSGKQRGATTWRCKECHGWDYRGNAGAYAEGSHFTGIKGITAFAGRPLEDIVSVLKDQRHGYDAVMLEYGLLRIAAFVSEGQVPMSNYIDEVSKRSNGQPAAGRRSYRQNCQDCHGRDGRKRNFNDDDKPVYIGTEANGNPWETLHKIRNGQPGAFVMGSPMPHMLGKLDLQEQIDLLSYMQTLPEK
ncbi:c-type cytochrome [Sulfuriflexus sp.]|uniref:c-type cytochrome n=1 Tax=Sulfuriflexus sp. TaxID=2015443 RepID=UPI0028CE2942|nr:c-type cytochrome [Sulfuriflexus sp.]MDT8403658.1 c-type cytochrome [Sulfuriflexus sp.]